jgi:hypothetical protein
MMPVAVFDTDFRQGELIAQQAAGAVAGLISQAIATERERCARIAEYQGKIAIAAAIRKHGDQKRHG